MSIQLIDTHCHIHEAQGSLADGDPVRDKWLQAGKDNADDIVQAAVDDGVTHMLCVGVDVADSAVAVDFVQSRPVTSASIGIHPHEADRYADGDTALRDFAALALRPKVVAVGECGLDYYYNHSPKADQARILRFQIELALQHDLPMIFHVRDAFDDFWPIFDSYVTNGQSIRGVIHSFSAGRMELEQILVRGLYVGLNGIMTFTKDAEQLAAARAVPLDKLLLETDAPYLTPKPYRGKICEPKHVRETLKFLAALREDGGPHSLVASDTTSNHGLISLTGGGLSEAAKKLAITTTTNARHLFNLHG